MNFSPEINEVIYILLLMCVALLKTKYVVIKINQKKKRSKQQKKSASNPRETSSTPAVVRFCRKLTGLEVSAQIFNRQFYCLGILNKHCS